MRPDHHGDGLTAIACFHCGEPVPAGVSFNATIDGQSRQLCCPGCQAVAQMISGSGLQTFYQRRTALSERPRATAVQEMADYSIYDDAQFQASFVHTTPDDNRAASLLLGGLSCAACTWLIEQCLLQTEGVAHASVHLANARLELRYNPGITSLSELVQQAEALGYRVRPYTTNNRRELAQRERQTALRRLAVAGLGMMQVGMFAIALHAGDLQGMDAQYQTLLRSVSLLVASFVVAYSARGFFTTAWRHLRAGTLVMDLPVSLAIALAWGASAWATLTGSGAVYFDSIVMFCFFLLLGRFLEQRVRQREAQQWSAAEDSLPASVMVWAESHWQVRARTLLTPGERVLLPAGTTVPIDARVDRGQSSVRESAFNGEFLPRTVCAGDAVYAGTLNLESPLEATVTTSARDTRLAALAHAVDEGQAAKPALAHLADRIAGYFVAAVLVITALTALAWLVIAPDRALWISLSVLVVSCPCALALATPAALTNATLALRRHGVIVRGADALQNLSRADHLIFDKTGTLTEGTPEIDEVLPFPGQTHARILSLAASLQAHSTHPLAGAFRQYRGDDQFEHIDYRIGQGIAATQGGEHIRLGSPPFCAEICSALARPPDPERLWIGLCRGEVPLAWVAISDKLRPEACEVVREATRDGISVGLLTGDSSGQGFAIAETLGIGHVVTGMSPQEKMHHVQALQAGGACVVMVGDGLNDAPVLAVANTSVAVTGATDLARAQADLLLLGDDLRVLPVAHTIARRTTSIIRQNIAWALTYNLSAIPLAAIGWVPPWLAAIGMSASSLLVVLNSLRLDSKKAASPVSGL